MATGEYVSLDDITRALIADGITDPAVLRTAVAIAARESGLVQGGYVESDLPETPGSASTWLDRYDPNAVGHGVFQFTPGKDWATNPMHPNMDGWTLQQQVDYFVQHYADNKDFSPWTYNPTYAAQVTSPDSRFVGAANASIQRVFSGQGLPPQAQSTVAIADKANQVLKGIAPSNSTSPSPASPVAPLPPQGNAPMPGPTDRTPFQIWLLEGHDIYTDKNGIFYTPSYPLPDGTQVQAFVLPDGRLQQGLPDGDPKAGAQYGSIRDAYRANGAPNLGGIKVVHSQTAEGNDKFSLAPGQQGLPPGTTQGPAATSSGGPNVNGQAQATNTITGGGVQATGTVPANVIPGTNVPGGGTTGSGEAKGTASAGPSTPATGTVPKGVIPGTNVPAPLTPDQQAQALRQAQASIPRPVGFIPPQAIPGLTGNSRADSVSNYFRAISQNDQQTGQPQGAPFYTSSNPDTATGLRMGGYPVQVSNSPGSISVASPAGGIGYNPFAIADAQKGLAAFNIPPPGSQISQSQQAALQDNPYSANNPLEQAALSGGLVKPVQFEQGGAGPNGSQPVTVHYAMGGHQVIPEPAATIGLKTGRIYNTISEVRPEAETVNPNGRVTIVNHVSGMGRYPQAMGMGLPVPHHDLGGGFDEGNFGSAQDSSGSQSVAPATSTPDTSSQSSAPATSPIASTPAPVSTPAITPATTTAGSMSTNYTLPQAPTPPSALTANLSSGIANPSAAISSGSIGPVPTLTNAQEYEQQLNQYNQQLSGLESQNAQQRLDNLNALNAASAADRNAIAAAQNARGVTDYKYGAAGLPKPTEIMPPLGTSGLGLSSPGAGIRYALLTPEDQYSRMNGQLSTASSALSSLVSSARQIADLQHQQFLTNIGATSNGSSSSSKSSSKSSATASGGLPPQNSFTINRGISG